MLQQTQVERVIPKYKAFLKQFPNQKALAQASLGDVLRAWQGLGYNRRAKMLHQCAKRVVEFYGGKLPRSFIELKALPGIGPYTAGAVMAFAYNEPTAMIETNIRTVYLHHFFFDTKDVHDDALMPIIENTLDRENPRLWYAALMDYGSHLKKTVGNVSRKSAHHTKQSKFKGSNREVRGAIIRSLTTSSATLAQIARTTGLEKDKIKAQITALKDEEMVILKKGKYQLT